LNQVIRTGKTTTWRFDKPERTPISIHSDLRSGLQAYQVVTDHPWVAVTDKTGNFAIRGLPAGKYRFKVWHETRGYLEKEFPVEVKVRRGDHIEPDLSASPIWQVAARRPAPATESERATD